MYQGFFVEEFDSGADDGRDLAGTLYRDNLEDHISSVECALESSEALHAGASDPAERAYYAGMMDALNGRYQALIAGTDI